MDIAILAPYLAGAVGIPVTNFIKSKFNLGGQPALWVAVGVSLVLGVAALALAGGLDFSVAGIFSTLAESFATATIIYKIIEKVTFKP